MTTRSEVAVIHPDRLYIHIFSYPKFHDIPNIPKLVVSIHSVLEVPINYKSPMCWSLLVPSDPDQQANPPQGLPHGHVIRWFNLQGRVWPQSCVIGEPPSQLQQLMFWMPLLSSRYTCFGIWCCMVCLIRYHFIFRWYYVHMYMSIYIIYECLALSWAVLWYFMGRNLWNGRHWLA